MSYGTSVRLQLPFADTVDRVRGALAERGFGVLTEIDVKATMKAKLGADMEEYVILGACNPPLAHRALESERSIGLLLPCNVVVRADGESSIVEFLDPKLMGELATDPGVRAVADEAAEAIQAVRDSVERQAG